MAKYEFYRESPSIIRMASELRCRNRLDAFEFTGDTFYGFTKRDLAIACRPSVRLSVCDVGGSGSHRLAILETNCTDD